MIRPSDLGAKERLLAAAKQIFALRGFKDGTVREICGLARANVALVKYHFGGKEQLYSAVLDSYMREVTELYPLDEGVGPDSPPQDRLRAFIRAFFKRFLSHGDPVFSGLSKLLTQEIFSPSQAFEPILEQHIKPCHERLVGIVRELLPDATEDLAARCAHSIEGQCVLYDFAKETMLRMSPELEVKRGNMEHVVEYMTEFSLGGIERAKTARAA
jgi:AcrR family transcriptional regulator